MQTVEKNNTACWPDYQTIDPRHEYIHDDPSEIPLRSRTAIAMVTMHDTRQIVIPRELAYMTGIPPGKSVDILEVVYRNRREYAEKHGYTLVDGTEFRGNDLKTSWYKIKVCIASHTNLLTLNWRTTKSWLCGVKNSARYNGNR
jgi:hypothetical protein